MNSGSLAISDHVERLEPTLEMGYDNAPTVLLAISTGGKQAT
jgi:hypothetical protein